ncbi:MAG: TetR/AcrR family transcriptional regulator [Lautropia sp.]|nr:TetR/AcrR family transcriptional regulator [Lautropia sp.]
MAEHTPSPSSTRCKRPRAWARRKEHRPGELLDAALEVFVARGYAAARLDDVAAKAGVSKGTLYLYYACKEELFKAVVRVNILPVIEQFRTRVEQATGSSEELLVDILHCWWSCFSKPKTAGILKLVMSEASNFPEVARFFHEEVATTGHEVVCQIIRRGIERQEFRPTPNLNVATHLVLSPLLLRLIWMQSVGACVPEDAQLKMPDFIQHHAALVLMTLRDGSAQPIASQPVPASAPRCAHTDCDCP